MSQETRRKIELNSETIIKPKDSDYNGIKTIPNINDLRRKSRRYVVFKK